MNNPVWKFLTDKILNDVVTDCNMQYGVCPFGCGKDGGPNCHQNIRDLGRHRQVKPGR